MTIVRAKTGDCKQDTVKKEKKKDGGWRKSIE